MSNLFSKTISQLFLATFLFFNMMPAYTMDDQDITRQQPRNYNYDLHPDDLKALKELDEEEKSWWFTTKKLFCYSLLLSSAIQPVTSRVFKSNRCDSLDELNFSNPRKLVKTVNNSFQRYIDINNIQFSNILRAEIPGEGLVDKPIPFYDGNGVKVFNVGAGNGITVDSILDAPVNIHTDNNFSAYDEHGNMRVCDNEEIANPLGCSDIFRQPITFQLNENDHVHWLIDAGSSSGPKMTTNGNAGPDNNCLIEDRNIETVAEEIAESFCPNGFRMGVIMITHTDADHYNLVDSILSRCAFNILRGKDLHTLRDLLTRVLHYYDANPINEPFTEARINALNNWNDYINTIHNGLDTPQKNKVMSVINRYISDHHFLWIMPGNFESTYLTDNKGFSNELKRLLGGEQEVDYFPSLGGIEPTVNIINRSGSKYPDGVPHYHQSVFPRNRISLVDFNNLPINPPDGGNLYNFEILNNPQRDNPTHFFECANPNQCSLIIRLRGKEHPNRQVLIFGDAWWQTFKDAFLDKYRARFFRDPETHVGTIVAPHHGSDTSDSHQILSFYLPQRVIFSSGKLHGHPTDSAFYVAVARLDASQSPYDNEHVFCTNGGKPEETRKNLFFQAYATAGTRQRVGGNYYGV